MRSLNSHLAAPDDHGQLPFHSGCPICRAERLAGQIPHQPIVSRNVQAMLLAATLALSAVGPGVALADARTSGDEGAAPTETTSPNEDDPGNDPGDEIPLPNEEAPPPPTPLTGGDDDSPGGPVETEPSGEPFGTPAPPPAPAAGPQANPPSPAPAPRPPAPGPPGPTPQLQASPPPTPGAKRRAPKREHHRAAGPRRHLKVDAPEAQAGPNTAPGRAGAPSPQTPATRTAGSPTTPAGSPPPTVQAPSPSRGAAPRAPIPAGADSYRVQAGDSLWSIATRQLGPGASPARVARQVERLWMLNGDRIATGDPDLIIAGQTLRLR